MGADSDEDQTRWGSGSKIYMFLSPQKANFRCFAAVYVFSNTKETSNLIGPLLLGKVVFIQASPMQ